MVAIDVYKYSLVSELKMLQKRGAGEFSPVRVLGLSPNLFLYLPRMGDYRRLKTDEIAASLLSSQ